MSYHESHGSFDTKRILRPESDHRVTRNRDIYGDDTDYELEYERASAKLYSAVALIKAIRDEQKVEPSAACDAWLGANGYETHAQRYARERKQREQRAIQLDAEIERLIKEREALK